MPRADPCSSLSESMVFKHRVITAVLVNLSVTTWSESYPLDLGRSVTTWSESYPLDLGRSVIKSMVIVPKGRSGISIGCKGTIVGCVSFLVD